MINLTTLLNTVVESNASDLHLIPGKPPILRIEGQLRYTRMLPLTQRDMKNILEFMKVDSVYMGRLIDDKSTDFRYVSQLKQKFRTNIVESEEGYKITMRNLNKVIPDLNTLGYEEHIFDDILKTKQGLVLLTGSTNSGKSTTLASLMQKISESGSYNIITLEDPIEYEFNCGNSILMRRELGVSFNDYPTAIHDAMRQDPDIVMVGEMRDAETIKATLLLSETGHLVLSSLHNGSLKDAYERMLLTFDAKERSLIKVALDKSLKFMMNQRLVFSDIDQKLHVEYNYKYYNGEGENIEMV